MRDPKKYATDLEYALSLGGVPETYAQYDEEKKRLESKEKEVVEESVVVSEKVEVGLDSIVDQIEDEKWICEICGWKIRRSCKGLISAHINKEIKIGKRPIEEK
jgi:rubrerythrin